MYLERALLQVGVSDIGMDRGEPVQRPAFGRRESQPAPSGAVASNLDVDLKVRRFRERDPDFAAQRYPCAAGNSPAVPTSAPRRSVTRARAAGALSPETVMRTRFLRPSAVETARWVGPR